MRAEALRSSHAKPRKAAELSPLLAALATARNVVTAYCKRRKLAGHSKAAARAVTLAADYIMRHPGVPFTEGDAGFILLEQIEKQFARDLEAAR